MVILQTVGGRTACLAALAQPPSNYLLRPLSLHLLLLSLFPDIVSIGLDAIALCILASVENSYKEKNKSLTKGLAWPQHVGKVARVIKEP